MAVREGEGDGDLGPKENGRKRLELLRAFEVYCCEPWDVVIFIRDALKRSLKKVCPQKEFV